MLGTPHEILDQQVTLFYNRNEAIKIDIKGLSTASNHTNNIFDYSYSSSTPVDCNKFNHESIITNLTYDEAKSQIT